jgi:uncharacterized protein
MNPFVVNIADILGRDVPPRPVRIEQPVEWGLELSTVRTEPPLVADLTVQPTSGGILVLGNLEFTVVHSCRRCLEGYVESPVLRVGAMFERTPEDETYPIEGDEIDLEPFLRDEVMLDLPMGPVCPDGCKEVVTTPESDLNTGSPGDEAESGSPFAVLRDLFEPGD